MPLLNREDGLPVFSWVFMSKLIVTFMIDGDKSLPIWFYGSRGIKHLDSLGLITGELMNVIEYRNKEIDTNITIFCPPISMYADEYATTGYLISSQCLRATNDDVGAMAELLRGDFHTYESITEHITVEDLIAPIFQKISPDDVLILLSFHDAVFTAKTSSFRRVI